MARRKSPWAVGDVVTIGLLDGTYVLAQVLGREPEVLNSATMAFFDRRFDERQPTAGLEPPKFKDAFSVLFVTRDLLDAGRWQVVARCPVDVPPHALPYASLRSKGWVGAKVIGSGIVEEFVNAYYGLRPWDDWHDPSYLDGLLVSPERKPDRLVYKRMQ